MRLIIHWLLSALALIIVAYLVPGFEISGIVPIGLQARLFNSRRPKG